MKKILLIATCFLFTLNTTVQETISDSLNTKTPVVLNYLNTLPSYPGGIDAFYNEYLILRIKKIKTKYKGKIYTSFVVEKDGSVVMAKVLNGTDALLNDELVKILNNSPKWNPGTKKGQPERCTYSLPLAFN